MFKFDKRDTLGTALRNPLERLPTEAGELFDLSIDEQRRTRNTDAIEYGLKQEYQTIIDDLEKRTGQRFINPANALGMTDNPNTGPAMHDHYVRSINDYLERNKEQYPDLAPINPDEVLKTVIEKGKAAREDWALAAEYAGTGATIAGFFGGVAGGVTDPVNIGATVSTLAVPPLRGLPFILREAGINMGVEVLTEPGKRDVSEKLGLGKRTFGDFASDVAGAGVFGGAAAGGVDLIGRGFTYMRSRKLSANRGYEAVRQDNPVPTIETPTGLPETHIENYDTTLAAMSEDGPVPDPKPISGPSRPPFVEGLELVDPDTVQVDARTFQFKEGGDAQGVTERLRGVEKWEQDFAGVALVYEKADGTRFIADGHQRLALAKRSKASGQDAFLNARIFREVDGFTPEDIRVRAAVKNIAEGTGSPLDAARILRAARDADLPPLPPTSALVRQGKALADLTDESFMMVVNGVVPENYGAIVGRLLKDPKLQEAAIRVLNKVNPDNAIQAETIVRQVGETEVTTMTQASLFGDEVITESLFGERAKVMDAALKSLKKDKQVFSTLVQQADRIEGAGNRLSRETNLERMTEDAKVAELIQRLASRKGPISDALTAAARALREGARPGDATRAFLKSVRGEADAGIDGGLGGRSSGQMADSERTLQPAEIKASQEAFEAQPENFLDQLISDQVDEALSDGRLSADTPMFVQDAQGNMVKKKAGEILKEIEADQTLVTELTACVEGAAEAVT